MTYDELCHDYPNACEIQTDPDLITWIIVNVLEGPKRPYDPFNFKNEPVWEGPRGIPEKVDKILSKKENIACIFPQKLFPLQTA